MSPPTATTDGRADNGLTSASGAARSVQAQPAELSTASLQALKQRAHQLLESQRSLQAQNQALTAERLGLERERVQQASQHLELSAERDALQAERDSLTAQLQELTAQRDSIQQQWETLQTTVEDLQDQLSVQSAQTAEQSQQREVLQRRVEELQGQLSAQSAQKAEQSQQREVLQRRVEELQGQLSAQSAQTAEQSQQREVLQRRVEELQGQLSAQSAQMAEQSQHLELLQGRLEKLELRAIHAREKTSEPETGNLLIAAYDWNEICIETDGKTWTRGASPTKDLFSQIADYRSPQGFFVVKRSRPSELCRLFDFYGSDKGSNSESGFYVYGHIPHSYGEIYEQLFCGIREASINLLECGIGSANLNVPSNMGLHASPGASLRAWRDYLPNSHIYGCDIDRACLFVEDRISTGYVNQLEPASILDMWEGFGRPSFDIIIDDGLHTADAAISLLRESLEFLSKNGVYIIEDMPPVELLKIDAVLCASRINYTIYAGLRRQAPRVLPTLDDNTMIVICARDITRLVSG